MAAFEYEALTPSGRTRKGLASGDTARQVRTELRDQGLLPLSVEEVKEAVSGSRRSFGSRRRLNSSELAVVTRQLSTLLGAGVPLEESLRGVTAQAGRQQTRSVLSAVRSAVVEGHTLADSLRGFPRSFTQLYTASVAAGEKTGRLAEVLTRLAEYTETRQNLRQRITAALVYPTILSVVAVLIVVGLLTYVVPQVARVFEDMGEQLPFLTRALLALSAFVREWGPWIAGAGILGAMIIGTLVRRASSPYYLHLLYLRLPVLGQLIRGLNAATMSRTLAIMTGSGVPLMSALTASAGVVNNVVMRQALQTATKEVGEGASLSRALTRTKQFPPILTQMVASGEASGSLGSMLEKAADAQEREVELRIGLLMSLFEPIMVLVMGAVVMLIVLAILLPIFSLNELIG